MIEHKLADTKKENPYNMLVEAKTVRQKPSTPISYINIYR